MFACIYVPNFPVAAVLRAEPELGSRALAILEGKPPLETILALNEKASRMGITTGTTKPQAELCEELVLRPHSTPQQSAAHAALMDCAQSFSPCVEDAACDTALLDLAGMESLLGSLSQIAHALCARAAVLGLDANVAVASNADAATIAARGFCGTTVIQCGKEAEQLASLPLEVLFANPGEVEEQKENGLLLETLERWGVRNLRALAALPEVALSERLGQQGLRLQQLARGTASRTLVPVEAPLIFEETVELEYPIVLLEPLAFLLNRLLDQICARLASRALAAQELRLTLELEPSFNPHASNESASSQSASSQPVSNQSSRISNHKFVHTLRLPLPMLDTKLFLKLLQLDLNAHPPGAPIVKIHLAAEPARPRPGQAGLFLPPSPEPEKLELTLARIAGIVGENKVGALELLDTHHPETFRLRRFVADVSRTSEKNSDTAELADAKEHPAVTALRRFRPPLRVTVTSEQSQPRHVACAKKEVEGSILWKAGPWRSSGDWWEREAWSRDEWDIAVQHAAGIALYRMVHDLLNGGWFLEGTYD